MLKPVLELFLFQIKTFFGDAVCELTSRFCSFRMLLKVYCVLGVWWYTVMKESGIIILLMLNYTGIHDPEVNQQNVL